MNYRTAREGDAACLAEMANDEIMPQDISEETMRDFVQDRTVWVAEEDGDEGEVVGYVSFRAVDDSVVVQHVCVEPGYRDDGVAGSLLEYPLEFAEKEGMSVRLAVEEDSWLVGSDALDGFEESGTASFGDDRLLIFERR